MLTITQQKNSEEITNSQGKYASLENSWVTFDFRSIYIDNAWAILDSEYEALGIKVQEHEREVYEDLFFYQINLLSLLIEFSSLFDWRSLSFLGVYLIPRFGALLSHLVTVPACWFRSCRLLFLFLLPLSASSCLTIFEFMFPTSHISLSRSHGISII